MFSPDNSSKSSKPAESQRVIIQPSSVALQLQVNLSNSDQSVEMKLPFQKPNSDPEPECALDGQMSESAFSEQNKRFHTAGRVF